MKWLYRIEVSNLHNDKDAYDLFFSSKKKAIKWSNDRLQSHDLKLKMVYSTGSTQYMKGIYTDSKGDEKFLFLSREVLN